ncbi:MAG: SLC13 family permease, partial [bacterium]|nr:SLC13 family permease [bacterium]
VLAPIALALAKQLETRAAPFLIGIALSANLQGTATLVGDPPSMILGAFANLTFNDFFWYHGRPGIFFAVQVGAIASFAMLWWLFRKFQAPVRNVPHDHAQSLVPSLLLVGVIVALALGSFLAHGPYTAGITVLVFAAVGWVWYKATLHIGGTNRSNHQPGEPTLTRLAHRFRDLRERFASPYQLIRKADWETTFFLFGIFVVVGSLSATGAIGVLTEWFQELAGGSVLRTYTLIVVGSVALSAFIDNVPFVLAMLPVAQGLAAHLGVQPFLFYAGLLIGASVGGNITPIGASANIVAYRWIEEKAEEPITFMGYVRYGLPFTLVAVAVAAVFGWFAWSNL